MNRILDHTPLLSIVTITYNDINGLKYTLESIEKEYEEIEYIIIDGHSTDGTKEYLKTLSDYYHCVSEPDRGLYDAMNKGQNMARGKYIIFMNSGDGFYSKDTIPLLLARLSSEEPDVLYGQTMYRDEENNELGIRSEVTTRKLPRVLNWKKLIKGMLVCHQSFIVKRELTEAYIQNNLSADYDWMVICLKKSTSIILHPGIIANYLIGGVSSKQKKKALLGRMKIMIKHYGIIPTLLAHLMMVFRLFSHQKWR